MRLSSRCLSVAWWLLAGTMLYYSLCSSLAQTAVIYHNRADQALQSFLLKSSADALWNMARNSTSTASRTNASATDLSAQAAERFYRVVQP